MANRFEQEISLSLRVLDWYAIKVPVAAKQGISFLNAAPFDFIAIKAGVPYSIEAKMCKGNDTNFPFSRLEAHQVENLLAFDAAGGRSYIAISFRKPKLSAYAIEINDWREMSRELLTVHKRKSIPRSWFTTDPRIVELPRIKRNDQRIWDFSIIRPSLAQKAA